MNFFKSDFLRFPLGFFCIYLLTNLFIEAFLFYIAHIICIRTHISFQFYCSWDGKLKKCKSYFGLHLPLDLISLFNIIILFNKYF